MVSLSGGSDPRIIGNANKIPQRRVTHYMRRPTTGPDLLKDQTYSRTGYLDLL